MFMMNTGKIYAQSLNDALQGLENATNSNSIGGVMDSVIEIAIPLAAVSVVILLVFAAYKLMTSQGNPDKLKEGKEVISNAIIGFLFVLMSVAILLLLSNLFGIDISGR
jgi:hypothetical protein